MEKVSFTYLSLKTGKCCNLLCLCIYNLPSDSLKFMWTIQEKTKKELRKCPQIKRFLGITFCTMSAIYICPLTSCQNWYTVNYVKYWHKVVMPTKRKINCLIMIGCINKQSMSFVMLIIRNSSNRPLHLHFFLDDSSGQGRGLFFIIYSFLLGLVLSQVIFFYKQKSFKSREIGSFFHIKTLFKSRRTKTHSIVWNTKFYHPTTRGVLTKSSWPINI